MHIHKNVRFAMVIALAFSGGAVFASEQNYLNTNTVSASSNWDNWNRNRDQDNRDQDQDKGQDHGDQDRGDQDRGDQHDGNGDQHNGDQNDGDHKRHDDDKMAGALRVDCRYHNEEKIGGIGSCYASALYVPTENGFKNVRLGVGCDFKTIYNNDGRVQTETLGERISPKTSAFPGVEVLPQGSLRNVGTYESVLDIRAGRLAGTCYVHDPYEFSSLSYFNEQFFRF